MIHREGYALISIIGMIFALVSFAFKGRKRSTLQAIFGFVFLFLCYFFRDPDRNPVRNNRALLSPADGKILWIRKDGETTTIRIFMSLFDVHINRAPCKGRVRDVEHKPGKFYRADSPKSDLENEYCRYLIAADGFNITLKQISGFAARKIVRWVCPGDNLEQGQKFGMIKLGSGCEMTFPSEFNLKVSEGDQVYAGLSIIAEK